MSSFDVSMGKIAHVKWRLKLIDFVYGQEDLAESDVKSHLECDFGKWLYSVGLKDFEHIPMMKNIEQEHKIIHDDIKRIYHMSQEQRKQEKEKIVVDFEAKCDHFVALLDKLNAEV